MQSSSQWDENWELLPELKSNHYTHAMSQLNVIFKYRIRDGADKNIQLNGFGK